MRTFVVFLCAIGLMAASYVPGMAAEKTIDVKLVGMKPEGEPETVGMRNFGKDLKELSGGKYDVSERKSP